MMTNYSLIMLSQAVRALVQHRKRVKKGSKSKFTFRAFMVDLVFLLSESLTGHALTAIFVCVSQAPANASQTVNALDFGKEFAKLTVTPRKVKPKSLRALVKEAKAGHKEAARALEGMNAKKGVKNRFRAVREGQMRDFTQLLALYARFQGGGGK